MYIVIRSWANASELADTMERRKQDVVDIIGTVPGLVAYHAVRSGDTVTTVTICESQEGTQESTRRAGEWVKANVSGASLGTPQIVEGESFVQL